jgi:hypothetical protein
MSINYQFSPVPFQLKQKMMEELRGNQYKIMDGIAECICLYPDTRTTFTKELSCRYLESIVNIRYDHISRHLKKLETKGFIKILTLGKYKEDGSIIQIIVPNSGNQDETTPKTGTNQSLTVPESGEKSTGSVPKHGTNKETSIQEKQQETTTTPSVKVVSSINNKDCSLIGILLPEAPKPEVRANISSSNDIQGLEFTTGAAGSIPGNIINKGIESLKARGITNIEAAIQEISTALNKPTVKNEIAYFLTLCKTKNDFQFNSLTASSTAVPPTPKKIVVDRGQVKREEDIRQAEEEKKQIDQFIGFVESSMPELLEAYTQRALGDWKKETKCFGGSTPWPGYVEAKIKVYAQEKGIWEEWLRTEGLNMN